jgi:hypothetical protein
MRPTQPTFLRKSLTLKRPNERVAKKVPRKLTISIPIKGLPGGISALLGQLHGLGCNQVQIGSNVSLDLARNPSETAEHN